MPPRKLREPSMPPSMEKVKGERLRTGWTTGTCAVLPHDAPAADLLGLPRGRTTLREEEIGVDTEAVGVVLPGPIIRFDGDGNLHVPS